MSAMNCAMASRAAPSSGARPIVPPKTMTGGTRNRSSQPSACPVSPSSRRNWRSVIACSSHARGASATASANARSAPAASPSTSRASARVAASQYGVSGSCAPLSSRASTVRACVRAASSPPASRWRVAALISA
ncbi:hypothetical protein J4558_10380 [Leptolyngbya sp. 15MV]|nr:hypothetical protein J4558_10380 [Leptolyngbya sp. 15MV]